jgi:hypothetical protein
VRSYADTRDDRMQEHHAPRLEFGDLPEHHSYQPRCPALEQAGDAGEGAASVGGEPRSQLPARALNSAWPTQVIRGGVSTRGDQRAAGQMPS